MARIEYTRDSLIIHVEGWDKVWALRSQLTMPLTHVIGAEVASEEAQQLWKGLRIGGTSLPGVITAGTFYNHGEWVFWDVHDADKAIAIHLTHEHYAHLVVQVDDPEATVAIINRAIHMRSSN